MIGDRCRIGGYAFVCGGACLAIRLDVGVCLIDAQMGGNVTGFTLFGFGGDRLGIGIDQRHIGVFAVLAVFAVGAIQAIFARGASVALITFFATLTSHALRTVFPVNAIATGSAIFSILASSTIFPILAVDAVTPCGAIYAIATVFAVFAVDPVDAVLSIPAICPSCAGITFLAGGTSVTLVAFLSLNTLRAGRASFPALTLNALGTIFSVYTVTANVNALAVT